MEDRVLISCEHGGKCIPAAYADLFVGWDEVLDTHRGFDRGALELAQDLATAFQAPLMVATVSRLLVDLNRSLSNPQVWSDVTRTLPEAVRCEIVQRHYVPYRQQVEAAVHAAVEEGCRVIHLSSHSFTPVLHGNVRNTDIGLLYDPSRAGEAALAARWQAAFATRQPRLRVRRNYPYAGKNDGLTRSLRKRFAPDHYVGIEIELNQAWVLAGGPGWRDIRQLVTTTLCQTLHLKPRQPDVSGCLT